MLHIRKYKNRKYYQPNVGHIALSDIWRLHKLGLPLEVRCASTRRDVTQEVLADAAYTYLPPYKREALIELSKKM